MLKHLAYVLKRGFWIVPLAWMLVVYTTNIHFGERYTSDSYGFYLLGKNIFDGNGYYSPAIRDFYINPDGSWLSRSFPPLFPFVVGLTDYFLNEGIAAGQIINLFFGIFCLYFWFLISKRTSYYLFFIPFILPIIHSVIAAQSLWVDAIAGRSNILTLLLLLITVNTLATSISTTNYKSPLLVGALLGLLTLTRFDTMVFCFSIPFIIFCFTRTSIKPIVLMYASLLLIMMPWALRNYIVFGSLLASDNALTVMSTHPRIVQLTFFERGIPLAADDPHTWLNQRLTYLKYNMDTFLSTFTAFNAKVVIFLYLLGLIFSFIFRKENYTAWIYFIISFTWSTLHLICLSLTPYGVDPRYYSISNFFIIGGASIFVCFSINKLIYCKLKKIWLPENKQPTYYVILFECLVLLSAAFLTIHLYSKELYLNKNDFWWQWTRHIENAPVKEKELVATREAELIAYYTNWNTIYLPENIAQFNKDYQAWLKHWKPSYLIVDLFDFNNSLVTYPHATVSTILDTVVLMKLHLDEHALTSQDAAYNTKMRNLWRQKIYHSIPTADGFFINDDFYLNGIARQWGGFFIQNTPENQLKFTLGRVIQLPNGEQRPITEVITDRAYLRVRVTGNSFTDQLSSSEKIEVAPFFLTNDEWINGIARHWTGFFVENTPEHLEQYQVGYIVKLPSGEERTIINAVVENFYLKIYLTGSPLDGSKVGTPDRFKITPK